MLENERVLKKQQDGVTLPSNVHSANIEEREEMLRQKAEELKNREAEENTRQMTFGRVSKRVAFYLGSILID